MVEVAWNEGSLLRFWGAPLDKFSTFWGFGVRTGDSGWREAGAFERGSRRPIIPAGAIRMAEWAIDRGLLDLWTRTRILGHELWR